MRPVLDSAWLRMSLVMAVVLALQISLIPGLRIADSTADLMLLFTICGAMVIGPERGAVLGFAIGLVFDIFLTTPFGLSALVYCLTGWLVGRIQVGVLRNSSVLPALTVGATTAGAVLAYALGLRLIDDVVTPWSTLGGILAVETAFNVLFAPVALRIARWALASSLEARSAAV
jgi:rod shape-determining protein MreD